MHMVMSDVLHDLNVVSDEHMMRRARAGPVQQRKRYTTEPELDDEVHPGVALARPDSQRTVFSQVA